MVTLEERFANLNEVFLKLNTPDCPEVTSSRKQLGVVLAIAGTFLFALKSIFIKLAFEQEVSTIALLSLRMFLALPFYIAVLFYSRRGRNGTIRILLEWREISLAMLLGFLGYYLASYLDLKGLEYISAQLERLTLFTYPTMIAVLAAVFLKEKITWRIVLSIALSYLGVWLMYGQEAKLSNSQYAMFGVGLVLGSAASYSLYVVMSKPLLQKIGSDRFTSLAMIGSTVFVGTHLVSTGSASQLSGLPLVVYLYGLLLAFLCTVLPSFMINEAIVRIGATRTTIIGVVGPVLTMFLAVAVLNEPSSMMHFLGMAVAIAGVWLVAVK